MPGQPCANHPNEITYVRCGRCDKPICVRCMVDSPVGKKCRECAQNRTHITESTPRQVILAFIAATAAAIPLGFVMHAISFFVVPFVYGYLVGEVALRAGQRRRSLAMQVAGGMAALIGGTIGALPHVIPLILLATARQPQPEGAEMVGYGLMTALGWTGGAILIGVVTAVWRVRYL